jgi:hypothetical protein
MSRIHEHDFLLSELCPSRSKPYCFEPSIINSHVGARPICDCLQDTESNKTSDHFEAGTYQHERRHQLTAWDPVASSIAFSLYISVGFCRYTRKEHVKVHHVTKVLLDAVGGAALHVHIPSISITPPKDACFTPEPISWSRPSLYSCASPSVVVTHSLSNPHSIDSRTGKARLEKWHRFCNIG